MGDSSATPTPEECPVIYVTGFGSFPGIAVNSSEKAVELLPSTGIEKKLGIRLVTETVKVEYDYVSRVIPNRWKELKPKLVVHVGVADTTKELKLEKLARNHGYNGRDNSGCLPKLKQCCEGGKDTIVSGIHMDFVAHKINTDKSLKISSKVSDDAGKYLCEYIYYCSLNEDCSRVAFVHVPSLRTFSAEIIAETLSAVVENMYQDVLEQETKGCVQSTVLISKNTRGECRETV